MQLWGSHVWLLRGLAALAREEMMVLQLLDFSDGALGKLYLYLLVWVKGRSSLVFILE